MSATRDHVVIDGVEQVLRCTRCQRTERIYFPVSVAEFVRRGKLFSAEHANCPTSGLEARR